MIVEPDGEHDPMTLKHPDAWALAANRVLKSTIGQLQMISTAALKLLQLTHDDNAQLDSLVKIVETEPTLAARVLNVVNSAKVSLPYPVQSIRHAINILGFNEMRQLVTEQLLYNQLIHRDSRLPFDQLFFWQHC